MDCSRLHDGRALRSTLATCLVAAVSTVAAAGTPALEPSSSVVLQFDGAVFDLVYNEARNVLWASIPEASEIVEISARTFTIRRRVVLGGEPRGLDLSHDGNRLYVAMHDSGTVAVVNPRSGEIREIIDVGVVTESHRVLHVREVTPTRLVVVTNPVTGVAPARLSVVLLDEDNLVRIVADGRPLEFNTNLAVDPGGDFLYLAHQGDGPLRIDLRDPDYPVSVVGSHYFVGVPFFDVSNDGARLYFGNGNVLGAEDLTKVGDFIADTDTHNRGVPALGPDDAVLYLLRGPDRIEHYDTATLEKSGEIILPCPVSSALSGPNHRLLVLPEARALVMSSEEFVCAVFADTACSGVPASPTDPVPADGSLPPVPGASLAWAHAATGCASTFEVRLDTVDPPGSVACDSATSPRCDPGTLVPETTYYWQVIAHNSLGSTAGPVWSFTTPPAGGGLPASEIRYGGEGQAVVYDRHRRALYVSIPDQNRVAMLRLDADSGQSFPVGSGARGIDLSDDGERLLVALDNGSVAIVDPDSGDVVRQIPVSHVLTDVPIWAVSEVAPNKVIAAAEYGRGLAIVHLDEDDRVESTAENISFRPDPSFATDRAGRFLYVSKHSSGGDHPVKIGLRHEGFPWVRIGTTGGSLSSSRILVISPDGNWLVNSASRVLRSGSHAVVPDLTTWVGPKAFGVRSDVVYVANAQTSTIDAWDLGLGRVVGSFPLPCMPTSPRTLTVLPGEEGWFVMGPDTVCGATVDGDGDGAVDRSDNCLRLANPDQADHDADGVGDVCDICPRAVNPDQSSTTACLDLTDDGGQCLEAVVDIVDPAIAEGITIDIVATRMPTELKFEWLGRSCGLADNLFILLNGTHLTTVLIDPGSSCNCNGAKESLRFTNAAAIAGSWNVDGPNEVRLVKPATDSALSWLSVEAIADITSRHCLLDYNDSDDCTNHTFCTGGESSDESFDVTESVGPLADTVRALTESLDSMVPPRLFALDGIPDSLIDVCVRTSRGTACRQTFKHGETWLAVNGTCGPPHADAGPDVTLPCVSSAATPVTLDGSRSSDPSDVFPGGGIVQYDWFEDPGEPSERYLGSGAMMETEFSLGLHTVGLRVTNGFEYEGVDAVAIDIADDVPPALSLDLLPAVLWPANHELVPVSATVASADACSAAPMVLLTSVASSEPDDAPGETDGETTNDVQGAVVGTLDVDFQVRAERDTLGNGRDYVVSFEAVDEAGNVSRASSSVHVPGTAAGAAGSLQVQIIEQVGGTVVEWTPLGGHSNYDVIRGRVENLGVTGDAIDLGAVTCIQSATEAGTQANPDAAVPRRGRAFFYLVGIDDGLGESFYGTDDADRPRMPSAGNCLL